LSHYFVDFFVLKRKWVFEFRNLCCKK